VKQQKYLVMVLKVKPEISEIGSRNPARFAMMLEYKLFYWFGCVIRTRILLMIMQCQPYELLTEM
jgi:hypothetical protein